MCSPVLLQQLYQTLSDYDIRYYIFEVLKVRNVLCLYNVAILLVWFCKTFLT